MLSQLLFADVTVLVADTKEKLKNFLDEFGRACRRKKLNVNVVKRRYSVLLEMV